MNRRKVRIVGAGLIGTSIALRLCERGHSVAIIDSDKAAEKLASDLLANEVDFAEPDLVIIAVPPSHVFQVLREEYQLNPNSTFMDVSSVKTKLAVEVESFPELEQRFVSTHPIAGRESGGAESAQSDLFEGRAWVISSENGRCRDLVVELIADLGATPYFLAPQSHDQLFARISHLPQVISTALANTLTQQEEGIDLAGPGLRDMSRLAGSDGRLWFEILDQNKERVLDSLTDFIGRLGEIQEAIADSNQPRLLELFRLANEQRGRITGKHGARGRNYTYLNIVIDDRPGQLGAIFNECAKIAVNVEDLTLEHSPSQLTGLIRLALSASDAHRLHSHLIDLGWKAQIA